MKPEYSAMEEEYFASYLLLVYLPLNNNNPQQTNKQTNDKI